MKWQDNICKEVSKLSGQGVKYKDMPKWIKFKYWLVFAPSDYFTISGWKFLYTKRKVKKFEKKLFGRLGRREE